MDRKHRQKGDIAFKLHNFLYLSRDVCEYSLSKLSKDQSRKEILSEEREEEARGLRKIGRMIDRFLEEESDYENIGSIFNKLKI